LIKRMVVFIVFVLIIFILFGVSASYEQSRIKFIEESVLPQELARISVENYIKANKIVRLKGELKNVDAEKAGVFVSIYKVIGNDKKLRGCIGTYMPAKKNIKAEIVHNAVSAAINDPRFEKIQKSELDKLYYSVDILSEPIQVSSVKELNHEKYGIILSTASGKRSVLLPELVGIDSIEEQVTFAKAKAGIEPDEEFDIKKFRVVRFAEEQ